MNYYELKKRADEWRQINTRDFHAEWPDDWPEHKRTIKYLDACKVAAHDHVRHCVSKFDKALEALKECISSEGSLAMTSESIEAAHRRLNAINVTVMAALKELEEVMT